MICSKKRDVGHSVSHSKRRTQRVRKPNLHAYTMRMTGESAVKMRLCTKCLRAIKSVRVEKPVVAVAN